jgi:hypothetical protein
VSVHLLIFTDCFLPFPVSSQADGITVEWIEVDDVVAFVFSVSAACGSLSRGLWQAWTLSGLWVE